MAAVSPQAAPVIGARVDPTLRAELEQIARENERNVSQEIRIALRRHVNDAHRALAIAAAGYTPDETPSDADAAA